MHDIASWNNCSICLGLPLKENGKIVFFPISDAALFELVLKIHERLI